MATITMAQFAARMATLGAAGIRRALVPAFAEAGYDDVDIVAQVRRALSGPPANKMVSAAPVAKDIDAPDAAPDEEPPPGKRSRR